KPNRVYGHSVLADSHNHPGSDPWRLSRSLATMDDDAGGSWWGDCAHCRWPIFPQCHSAVPSSRRGPGAHELIALVWRAQPPTNAFRSGVLRAGEPIGSVSV